MMINGQYGPLEAEDYAYIASKGAATMTSYERQAHEKADRLSRQHEDEYYVMRDECYEDCERESFYVVSGTRFDAGMAELESCRVVAAYSGGCRLPN